MTYTLKNESGFYAELESTYGINRTWVTFKDIGGPQRTIGHCRPDECSSGTDYRYKNKPQAADSSLINPANPKDVVTAAMPSIEGVMDNILATWLEMSLGGYNGSMQDVPDTFSLPVFMIQQAVNSMETVKNLGEQQAKRDKIGLILEILGIVLRSCRSLTSSPRRLACSTACLRQSPSRATWHSTSKASSRTPNPRPCSCWTSSAAGAATS